MVLKCLLNIAKLLTVLRVPQFEINLHLSTNQYLNIIYFLLMQTLWHEYLLPKTEQKIYKINLFNITFSADLNFKAMKCELLG